MNDSRERYEYEYAPAGQRPAATDPTPEPQFKKNAKKNRKRYALSLFSILVVAGIAAGAWVYIHSNNGPIPKKLRESANFPIYYPSPMPAGYTYKKGSARLEGGLVFYTLSYHGRDVLVSEQAIPKNPPKLNNIQGFVALSTQAGPGAIGTNSGQPTVIIESNTTLITINGSSQTPSDSIQRLAASFISVD